MSVEQMLEDLRRGWIVEVTSTVVGWCVALYTSDGTRRTSDNPAHAYSGPGLASCVRRAWAGERGDPPMPFGW